MNRLLSGLGTAALLWASPGYAAQPVGTHTCASQMNAAERLACYDLAYPPVQGSQSGLNDREAERQQAVRDFGLSRHQLRKAEPERAQDIAPDRLGATVTRISYTADGKRVIALDNDQTWLLTENTWRGNLEVGDAVTLREAALGTHMLVTPRGIALRARRTR